MSQTVQRARTTLTYDGATSGDFHDPAVLAATLTRTYDASRVAGRTVHFTMASESCDGTTNAAGRASCSITPQEPAGGYTVAASFAGDAGSQPSGDSGRSRSPASRPRLTYTGGTVILNGGTSHASAVVKEDDGAAAIAGRRSRSPGQRGHAQSCTGLTDSAGLAACDISAVSQPLGAGTVKTTFAQDAYYLASSDADAAIALRLPEPGRLRARRPQRGHGSVGHVLRRQWPPRPTPPRSSRAERLRGGASRRRPAPRQAAVAPSSPTRATAALRRPPCRRTWGRS